MHITHTEVDTYIAILNFATELMLSVQLSCLTQSWFDRKFFNIVSRNKYGGEACYASLGLSEDGILIH